MVWKTIISKRLFQTPFYRRASILSRCRMTETKHMNVENRQCHQMILNTNERIFAVLIQTDLCRRSMSSEPHRDVINKMHEFLQTFYASQEHGILSIEQTLFHTIENREDQDLTALVGSSFLIKAACKKFCQMYRTLTLTEKATFLCHLAESYGVNQEMVVSVAQQVLTSKERGEATVLRAEDRLRSALVARYHVLFMQIGRIDGGVKFLADMRADILTSLSAVTTDVERAHLQSLQSSLKELLSLWFTVGFLNLDRLTWQSSCDMLQKISEYEVVHPIRHWGDLKRRVGAYRRCFVFLHSSMPREPIVVLHTALTNEISSSIHSIIGTFGYMSSKGSTSNPTSPPVEPHADRAENPSEITTAMFYSITSTQKGLQGVDLGNYLIKKVVAELQHEFPQMSQFSSLSPIPGYKDWLIGKINAQLHRKDGIEEDGAAYAILNENDITALQAFSESENENSLDIFKRFVSNNYWSNSVEISEVMREPLMRNCAKYLFLEKRRGYALNPVANFHLQNGAVLWRINWVADVSLRGLTKSCGIMVNYRYYLEDTERNSQQYIEHQIINTTPQIREYCQA